jgi:hypothetical protein
VLSMLLTGFASISAKGIGVTEPACDFLINVI